MAKRKRKEPKPQSDVSLNREMEAWALRCKGWSQARIATHLGIAQSAVWALLRKARTRVKGDIKEYIVEHIGQLDHIVEQMSDSWHKSLEPLRSVRQTRDEEGREVTVSTATEREGTVGYIDRWLAALDRKAKVLGLNVADATQEPAFTVCSLSEEVEARGKSYEGRKAEVSPGDAVQREAGVGGGTGAVQDGPGPVQ